MHASKVACYSSSAVHELSVEYPQHLAIDICPITGDVINFNHFITNNYLVGGIFLN